MKDKEEEITDANEALTERITWLFLKLYKKEILKNVTTKK